MNTTSTILPPAAPHTEDELLRRTAKIRAEKGAMGGAAAAPGDGSADSLSDESDAESESTNYGSKSESGSVDEASGSELGDDDAQLSLEEVEEKMVGLFLPPSHKDYGAGMAGELAATLNEMEETFMGEAKVAAPNTVETDLAAFYSGTEMADEPAEVESYLRGTVEPMVEHSIHCCAPTMIGHMTTSLPFYMRPLSKLLTTLHANNVKVETGKSTTFIEKEVLAMLHRELFQMPEQFYAAETKRADVVLGVVTSGGTIANNTALWIARNRTLPAIEGGFRGCDKQGLVGGLLAHGYTGACVIGSEVMHYSMKKSADVLGIGTEGLRTCPFGPDYRVDVGAMREQLLECRRLKIAVLALVGVAGGTETGSIDDLAAIADLAQEFGVHFHVDAAWGGPVIFSEQHKHKIAGIERADTVTLDGHKQLYTPMGCGICFLRNPQHIDAVQKTANYIIRKDSHDLGKFTMEGSRPAVAVFLHANLKVMGVKGYGALVDRSIRMTRHMVNSLRATGAFETVLDPMTNILLYRYLPEEGGLRAAALRGEVLTSQQNAAIDAANVQLQNAQKRAGATFVSRTTIFNPTQKVRSVALRVVIANPLTTERDIDNTLADQLTIAKTLFSASGNTKC